MIIVDLETSGIDPSTSSILSIGAVDFHQPLNQFYAEGRLENDSSATAESLSINGFTPEQINDPAKLSTKELVKSFIAWLHTGSDQLLAGQNPHFDWAFLQAASQKYQLNYRFDYHLIDLHSVCFAHMCRRGITPPLKNGISCLNTDFIHPYCGLPEEPKPHNALNGAKYEAEAFARLLTNQSLLDEFAQYPLPF